MAAARNDIVAMGNAIVDIVCQCDDDQLARTSAPKGHMTLVHSLSEISELVSEMPRTLEVAGGAAVNAAVGVASLGGRSTFIGRVADDRLGNLFRHDIKGIGVTFRAPPAKIATWRDVSIACLGDT